ncbi:MAG TPA: molybdenum cofactor biosynthesis protein MoaE [Thermoplasmata archaeon]|nr:molybdenum cofactor biosynthesis protein MoaE [Thermoplasmata archaeon]
MGVRLVRRPLSVARAYAELEGSGLGAVTVFVGRVRPDPSPQGRVEALDYEADLEPALRRLRAIEARAHEHFGAGRTVLWHRIGRVPAGEVAVIAGAAAGHRAEAFRAARYLIEELKRTVPIWKTERSRPGRPPRPRPGRRGARSSG